MNAIRRKIVAGFKLRGFSLQGSALDFIIEKAEQSHDVDQTVKDFLEVLVGQNLDNAIVSRKDLESAKQKSDHVSSLNPTTCTTIISAFEFPHLTYEPVSKRFSIKPAQDTFFAAANAKAQMLTERRALIRQRLLRHPLFQKPAADVHGARKRWMQLTNVDALVGNPGTKYVLGMLSQLTDGKFFLEDPNGKVEVDLSHAHPPDGLFLETCMVFAEGSMTTSGVFQVSELGFPPSEARADSLRITAGLDCFGGLPDTGADYLAELHRACADHEGVSIAVFSDVYLDDVVTMERFRYAMGIYESRKVSPFVIVLCGNFSSEVPQAAEGRTALENYARLFSSLARDMRNFPFVTANSHFVFVPGPSDYDFSGGVLPRTPLPSAVQRIVAQDLPNATFTSNPCRIRYFDQEIVIFRENLLQKLRRNCFVVPRDSHSRQLAHHLVKTVCDQGHLCPLPLLVQPVYWKYDHALRLYPLPNILILADQGQEFEIEYEGVKVFNPGAFAHDHCFGVYHPASGEVDASRVPGPGADRERLGPAQGAAAQAKPAPKWKRGARRRLDLDSPKKSVSPPLAPKAIAGRLEGAQNNEDDAEKNPYADDLGNQGMDDSM